MANEPGAFIERRRTPREPTLSRFLTFSREEWAPLRANTPLTLSDADLVALRGLNDVLSMEDVVEIYLPLSRLLSLYVLGTRRSDAMSVKRKGGSLFASVSNESPRFSTSAINGLDFEGFNGNDVILNATDLPATVTRALS